MNILFNLSTDSSDVAPLQASSHVHLTQEVRIVTSMRGVWCINGQFKLEMVVCHTHMTLQLYRSSRVSEIIA